MTLTQDDPDYYPGPDKPKNAWEAREAEQEYDPLTMLPISPYGCPKGLETNPRPGTPHTKPKPRIITTLKTIMTQRAQEAKKP